MDQLKLTDNMFPLPPTASLPAGPGSGLGSGSPGKKTRKMATRKWDLAPEDDI